MATITKKLSFLEKVLNGELNSVKEKIYHILWYEGEKDIYELSNMLNVKVATISGRISELYDEGLVNYYVKKDKEGKSISKYYAVKSELERKKLRHKAKRERLMDWIKMGFKYEHILREYGVDIKRLYDNVKDNNKRAIQIKMNFDE